MKKLIIISIFFAFFSNCSSTKQPLLAKKNNKGNLVGIANKNSFIQEPYKIWFQQNYNNYTPDASVISELKPHLKNVKIKGFMGTWCSDSKRETPRFYKVLEQSNFDQNNLELITVNRDKKTPDNQQKGFNITNVPTFIFYREGKEIGRFVEYPIETIEKDFLKIVSGKDYKHPYAQ